MSTISADLRNKLERTCIAARNLAEQAARAALEGMAVQAPGAYAHMTREQKDLRNKLRARGRQLGDVQDSKDNLAIDHLAQECGYEHWHRMLFARFLAENSLLIEPGGVALSLEMCKDLATEENTNLWALAGRFAQTMLPEIFRADDPVLQVPLAREDQLKLEQLLDGLSGDVFTASDSLGWCYQFWQAERKDEVNASGNKIGADELPSVTQLFTEDYMVDFLLDNTLGAWWAGKKLPVISKQLSLAKTEEECRRLVALPGCAWKYLRFVKGKDGTWAPAAGTFEGWPKTAKELKCLDPCMGSGHFVVAMFERLVALRMAEEKLDDKDTVAAVIRDNLFGLEIDPRCTQIAAFNLALAAWRRVGHCPLPPMNLACSGLAPNAKKEDWLKLAGKSEKLQRGMDRLYQLFQKAPVLGSLINPRAGERDLLVASFFELEPLLDKALAQVASDDAARELAVTARGLAKAAELLACQFSLVATNVPYLGRGKQVEVLQEYCEIVYGNAKSDLATCFIERSLAFCSQCGSVALVTPQSWLFQGVYQGLREKLVGTIRFSFVAKLGEHAFESPQAAGAFSAMACLLMEAPDTDSEFAGFDATGEETPNEKAILLACDSVNLRRQRDQRVNPDCRIVIEAIEQSALLCKYADCIQGIKPADRGRLVRTFWEHALTPNGWECFMGSTELPQIYAGRYQTFDFATFRSVVDELGGRLQGRKAWKKCGVSVGQMRSLPVTLYSGEPFDGNAHALVPHDVKHLPAIWCFCSSAEFAEGIRKLDQKLDVTNATVVKVAFDLAHWQKVAAKKYPHGLPKPFSSDPTQWLFDGHPKGSDHPLHVAVARLLGYQWPRQTGSSFPDCPALDADGLEQLADTDGIVCIPSARGEEPAAERLRKLLVAAYGKEWKSTSELDLIRATGSTADDFDEWLRNDFFEQHCNLFHQRPFLWHIWDGRKRDGFHAVVNYHRLAEGDVTAKDAKGREKGSHRGRRVLESLTHSYLGEWIGRQRDGEKRGDDGAEERLAAALELKTRLEAILEGEPPFDLFVRWKPLAKQAVGWEPDINDGVRMNIRPFLASDLPAGKKGAGILRAKPGIKWDKDRGKEPHRDKKEFPWFWAGGEFTGDRVNDVHLTSDQKLKARKE